MKDYEWYWRKEYDGCVTRDEKPIVTLAKAGLLFNPTDHGVNLNHIQEALSQTVHISDAKKRKITVEITVEDEEIQ